MQPQQRGRLVLVDVEVGRVAHEALVEVGGVVVVEVAPGLEDLARRVLLPEGRELELGAHVGLEEVVGPDEGEEERGVFARRDGHVDRREVDLGSTRVIQRRFNVAVPRARVPKKDGYVRDCSER